jgi:hypothetical protein
VRQSEEFGTGAQAADRIPVQLFVSSSLLGLAEFELLGLSKDSQRAIFEDCESSRSRRVALRIEISNTTTDRHTGRNIKNPMEVPALDKRAKPARREA